MTSKLKLSPSSSSPSSSLTTGCEPRRSLLGWQHCDTTACSHLPDTRIMYKLSWYPGLCMLEWYCRRRKCFEHFLARKLSRDYADLFAEHRKRLFRSGSTVSQAHQNTRGLHIDTHSSRCLFIRETQIEVDMVA